MYIQKMGKEWENSYRKMKKSLEELSCNILMLTNVFLDQKNVYTFTANPI